MGSTIRKGHTAVAAAYPDGEEYQTYIAAIEESVGRVAGKIPWRTPMSGQPAGCDHDGTDEILSVSYPSHTAFLNLRNRNEDLFRLRDRLIRTRKAP